MISATQRLSRELPKLHKDLPPGIALAQADGFDEWFMDISVPDANPLYVNQTFRLKFKFSEEYPISEPPPISLWLLRPGYMQSRC